MNKNVFPALQNLKTSMEIKDWWFSLFNGKGVESIRERPSFLFVFKRPYFIYCQDKITPVGNQKFTVSLMSFFYFSLVWRDYLAIYLRKIHART